MPATDPVQAVAEALDKNFNPDRYPVMAAMFMDYAEAAVAAARPLIEREAKAAALVRVRRYAEGHAITAKANGRDNRDWLDLLIILDQEANQ